LNLRDPSCARAAAVSDGANTRTEDGNRSSNARTHDPCKAPVASTATTGAAAPARRRIVATTSSNPGRSDGTDIGSTSSPASPVLNHTRCCTLPGSIATTNAEPDNAC
jgi:hypothetical protein